jgi:phytoene dehydrogenase-like protein
MPKSIIIIGAGMGGLAAGIYGQMNGFDTRIYEMHNRAGGQCTSWKREGYTFDACIHHLMGCSPSSKIHRIWAETGALPTELVYTKECVAVASPDGKLFRDFYDPDALEAHMSSLSPADAALVREYTSGIRSLAKHDLMGQMIMGGPAGLIKYLPTFLKNFKWFRTTMAQYAERFTDPFLKRAFALLVYSNPDLPAFLHLMRHASACNGDIAWPVGASSAFAAGMVRRYESLGGALHCRRKVKKILTGNGRAIGVRLEDGSEEFADVVISNADGRKTLLNMLEGKFMNDRLRGYCAEPADESDFAASVYLGVNRDLSREPSSMILLLDHPVTLAGLEAHSLEFQMYGFDTTMAPEGKGVIKAELRSTYSYWKALDKEAYAAEKQRLAEQVIALLETRFPGITQQVEVTDVTTLLTWERFMGGTHGFANIPSKRQSFMSAMGGSKDFLHPELDNFYFVGVWATSVGALFMNALSGKKAIQHLCKKEGQTFRVVPAGN